MSDRSPIYKDCCSRLGDRRIIVRDKALSELLPHMLNVPEIHDHLNHILTEVTGALDKGCNVQHACIIVQKAVLLDPRLDTVQSTITLLTKHLPRAIKEKQFDVYAASIRTIGFLLMLSSKFNPDKFPDVSESCLNLINSIQNAIKYHYRDVARHQLHLIAGLSCAYIALDPSYRKGFGYDLICPLVLFFMTKNLVPEITAKSIPLCLNLLLIAIQAHSNKALDAEYPTHYVDTYRHCFIQDPKDDDGTYVEITDEQVQPEDAKYNPDELIYIPLLEGGWDIEDLLQRIELIFDGSSMSLDNEYEDEDLEMIDLFVKQDLYSIREQLNSGKVLDSVKAKLDKGHTTSLLNSIPAPHEPIVIDANQLLLPEHFSPHKHRFAKHYPKHYKTFEGRIIYFMLPLFNLLWDQVLNWQYVGDLLGSTQIQERIDQEMKDALKQIYDAEATQYERRLGKKDRDIAERHDRDEKTRYMFDNTENEVQFTADDVGIPPEVVEAHND
eukprot:UN04009